MKVVLLMPGSGLKAGQAQPMQNNIDRRQAVLNAEFIVDDPADVLASETADGILGFRACQYTFS